VTGYPSPTASWNCDGTSATMVQVQYTTIWSNVRFDRLSEMCEELEEAERREWMGFVGYEKRHFDKPRFESRRIERYNWRSGEPERFRLAR
jgi:hypothetical protein